MTRSLNLDRFVDCYRNIQVSVCSMSVENEISNTLENDNDINPTYVDSTLYLPQFHTIRLIAVMNCLVILVDLSFHNFDAWCFPLTFQVPSPSHQQPPVPVLLKTKFLKTKLNLVFRDLPPRQLPPASTLPNVAKIFAGLISMTSAVFPSIHGRSHSAWA